MNKLRLLVNYSEDVVDTYVIIGGTKFYTNEIRKGHYEGIKLIDIEKEPINTYLILEVK